MTIKQKVENILGKELYVNGDGYMVFVSGQESAIKTILHAIAEDVEGREKKPYKTTESRYNQPITIPISYTDKIYNSAITDIVKMLRESEE